MELIIAHSMIVLLSGYALLVLGKCLIKAPKGSFVITMILPFIFVMFVTALYSTVYIIDHATPFISILSPYFYNYFSLFLRVQNTVSIIYVAESAIRRMK